MAFRDLFYGAEGKFRNGWWALIFLGFLYGAGVVGWLLTSLLSRLGIPRLALLPLDFFIILLALWPCLRLRKEPWGATGFRMDGRWFREAALGTGIGTFLMILTALLVLGGHGLIFHRNAMGGWGPLLRGLWIFIWVAFTEETLFRGFFFQRLVDGLGAWPAQFLVAALFALAHWRNPGMHGATKVWATLNIALAAVLLGLAFLRTRSLALPIGIHLGWNFTQGNLLGFGVSGTDAGEGLLKPVFASRPEWFTGGAFGLEASLPCALVCILFIAWLHRRQPAGADA